MKLTRNRNGRMRLRRGNGRFARANITNVFGLKAPVCLKCWGFKPHGVDEPQPETCHHCGEKLVPLESP